MSFRVNSTMLSNPIAPQPVIQKEVSQPNIKQSTNLDDLSIAAQFFSPGPLMGNNLVIQLTKQIDLNNNFKLNNTGQKVIVNIEGTYCIDLTFDYLGSDTSVDQIQIRSPPSSENYVMVMYAHGTKGQPVLDSHRTHSAKTFYQFSAGDMFDVFFVNGPQAPISSIRLNIERIGSLRST